MMRFRPKIFLSLAGGMLALVLVCFWLWFIRDLSEPMPNPNGYHNFVAAAKALEGHRYAYGEFSPGEAVQFVEANQAAFALYRQGLQEESRIPVAFSTAWFDQAVVEMSQIKRLVHSILTEARVAHEAGDSKVAFHRYCDALRFSYQIPRGGLWLHYKSAQSYKGLVFRAIEAAIPRLTGAQRQELLRLVNQLEDEQEPLKTIALRERNWHLKTGTFTAPKLISSMIRLRSRYPELSVMEPAVEKFQPYLARFRESLSPSSRE